MTIHEIENPKRNFNTAVTSRRVTVLSIELTVTSTAVTLTSLLRVVTSMTLLVTSSIAVFSRSLESDIMALGRVELVSGERFTHC